jgi:hypothetical protein
MKNNIEVVTILENGSKVKFLMKYSDFILSLKNDRKMGMKMWLEDDTITTSYSSNYHLKGLTYGNISGNLEKVEFIAVNDNNVLTKAV